MSKYLIKKELEDVLRKVGFFPCYDSRTYHIKNYLIEEFDVNVIVCSRLDKSFYYEIVFFNKERPINCDRSHSSLNVTWGSYAKALEQGIFKACDLIYKYDDNYKNFSWIITQLKEGSTIKYKENDRDFTCIVKCIDIENESIHVEIQGLIKREIELYGNYGTFKKFNEITVIEY